jgi:hypothetical protein
MIATPADDATAARVLGDGPPPRVRVLILYPFGQANELLLEADAAERLAQIRGLLGGYARPLYGDGWVVYLDEDGQAKRLEPNQDATRVVRRLGGRCPLLLGPAIFTGQSRRRDTDVPAEVLDAYLRREVAGAKVDSAQVAGSATACQRCGEGVALVAGVGGTGEYVTLAPPHVWTCRPTLALPLRQHAPATYADGTDAPPLDEAEDYRAAPSAANVRAGDEDPPADAAASPAAEDPELIQPLHQWRPQPGPEQAPEDA